MELQRSPRRGAPELMFSSQYSAQSHPRLGCSKCLPYFLHLFVISKSRITIIFKDYLLLVHPELLARDQGHLALTQNKRVPTPEVYEISMFAGEGLPMEWISRNWLAFPPANPALQKEKGLIHYLYFAVCQCWSSATSASDSSQVCSRSVTLVEEWGNAKKGTTWPTFVLHIYTLQILISLRWQRTYGEST